LLLLLIARFLSDNLLALLLLWHGRCFDHGSGATKAVAGLKRRKRGGEVFHGLKRAAAGEEGGGRGGRGGHIGWV
jgi:hypothetical protein